MSVKKAAYITRHAVTNYGSLLQAYALQSAVERLGFNAECINYIRTDEKPSEITNTLLGVSRWSGSRLGSLIFKITQKPILACANRRFKEFRTSLLKLSREYNTVEELEKSPPKADIFLTGSDQVWGGIFNKGEDSAYFLEFLPDGKARAAYGASFGCTAEVNKSGVLQALGKYKMITVREESGNSLLREMGLNSFRVLDPIFLLDRREWEHLIPDGAEKKRYILVYQLNPRDGLCDCAKYYSRLCGLPVYRVHPYFHHIFKYGKFIFCPPPQEFLRCLKNAELVISDSFHAAAFSVLFNVSFISVPPCKNSERITDFLRLVGLEDRIFTGGSDGFPMPYSDFKNANGIIKTERARSLGLLEAMLDV